MKNEDFFRQILSLLALCFTEIRYLCIGIEAEMPFSKHIGYEMRNKAYGNVKQT